MPRLLSPAASSSRPCVPASPASAADGLAVEVTNASEPVLCAEKDNVTIKLASPEVRSFRIEAAHPAYIGSAAATIARRRIGRALRRSISRRDLRGAGRRTSVTFYEDVEIWLTGFTFPNFWRPNDMPFRVGDRVENGIHLVQLWVRAPRARRGGAGALSVGRLLARRGRCRRRICGWSAYGSSFLIGPVEVEGRPIVKIREIEFDPETRTFRSPSRRRRRDASARQARPRAARPRRGLRPGDRRPAVRGAALDVRHRDQRRRRPHRAARGERQGLARGADHGLQGREGDRLWAGRLVPSRHNTSAPDHVFNRFR